MSCDDYLSLRKICSAQFSQRDKIGIEKRLLTNFTNNYFRTYFGQNNQNEHEFQFNQRNGLFDYSYNGKM